MRTFFWFLFSFISLQASAQTNFTFPAIVVEYDSAIVFGKLKIIPVKRFEQSQINVMDSVNNFLSLQYGMKKGIVIVKERGNYAIDNLNVLLLKNNSNKNLVLKSGDILIGGRQDRVIAKDTILPPGNFEYQIPVFCIEETRWSKREEKFTYGGSASSGIQNIIDTLHNQIRLWDEIRKLLNLKNQSNSSSYALFINNKKLADTSNLYVQYFLSELAKKDSSIVGIIASTGNQILGSDVFINSNLFYQTCLALLNKYSLEAIESGSYLTKQNQQEINFANEMFSPATQNSFLNKKGKRIYFKGSLIQISGYAIHY